MVNCCLLTSYHLHNVCLTCSSCASTAASGGRSASVPAVLLCVELSSSDLMSASLCRTASNSLSLLHST